MRIHSTLPHAPHFFADFVCIAKDIAPKCVTSDSVNTANVRVCSRSFAQTHSVCVGHRNIIYRVAKFHPILMGRSTKRGSRYTRFTFEFRANRLAFTLSLSMGISMDSPKTLSVIGIGGSIGFGTRRPALPIYWAVWQDDKSEGALIIEISSDLFQVPSPALAITPQKYSYKQYVYKFADGLMRTAV